MPKKTKKKQKTVKQRLKVLLVDDDCAVLDLLASLLKKTCDVSVALSGEDGLALAGRTKYNLAFVDLVLPGMDGLALLKQLKKISPETDLTPENCTTCN